MPAIGIRELDTLYKFPPFLTKEITFVVISYFMSHTQTPTEKGSTLKGWDPSKKGVKTILIVGECVSIHVY